MIEEHDAEFGEMYEHGRWGQQIDQGDADISEQELRRVHLPPYVAAIGNGARSIMVSLSSWQDTKLHAHRYLLTDVLKGELGFDGFVVSDWLGLEYLGDDYYKAVVFGINAGLDMVMVPHDWEQFMVALIRAAESGDVPMERIDDAVRRILRVKAEMGLFDGVLAAGDAGRQRWDRQSTGPWPARPWPSRSCCCKTMVPFRCRKDAGLVYVAGGAAADIGLQCGGWTIEWRGIPGGDIPGTTLLQAVAEAVTDETEVIYDAAGHFDDRMADVGVVVIAEPPYAEMTGDRADLTLPPEDIELIERMRSRCRTLVGVLYTGRPLLVTDQAASSTDWLRRGCRAAKVPALPTCCSVMLPFTGKTSVRLAAERRQIPLAALEAIPIRRSGRAVTGWKDDRHVPTSG